MTEKMGGGAVTAASFDYIMLGLKAPYYYQNKNRDQFLFLKNYYILREN